MTAAVAIWMYVLGVVLGLWRVDGTPLERVLLAVAWPVGLAACLLTLATLALAALLLFPAVAAAAAVLGGLAWWFG